MIISLGKTVRSPSSEISSFKKNSSMDQKVPTMPARVHSSRGILGLLKKSSLLYKRMPCIWTLFTVPVAVIHHRPARMLLKSKWRVYTWMIVLCKMMEIRVNAKEQWFRKVGMPLLSMGLCCEWEKSYLMGLSAGMLWCKMQSGLTQCTTYCYKKSPVDDSLCFINSIFYWKSKLHCWFYRSYNIFHSSITFCEKKWVVCTMKYVLLLLPWTVLDTKQ